jgi:hypothetical protein
MFLYSSSYSFIWAGAVLDQRGLLPEMEVLYIDPE